MKFIIGKKLDMTQVWRDEQAIAVTRVQAGPCAVTQVKSGEKDGYEAVQVGYGKRKAKNINKPQRKDYEAKIKNNEFNHPTHTREFRFKDDDKNNLNIGDVIDVRAFTAGDIVQATSTSKGKGFQGVVKRYGFHGQDKTHGNKDQLRMPGSIGATGPAHVFKGQKMPGRMGNERVTVKNLEVIEVDQENNILLIKGAVPGARNGLVLISGDGEIQKLKVESDKVESCGVDNKNENVKISEIDAGKKDEQGNTETQKRENKEEIKQGNKKVIKQDNEEVKEEDIEEVVVEAKERKEQK